MGELGLVIDGRIPPGIFITNALAQRPCKTPNHYREKLALQDLASRMADTPKELLPRLVDLAMELTGGSSSGISIFEQAPAPGVFRWRYLRGTLAHFDGATTPRDFSPCGITLDQNRPVLSQHPELYYNWISDADIVVPEVLLVPLYYGSVEPLGTLWIVADKENHFDSEDARVAVELAAFAGIALRMAKNERDLQTALEEQETLTKEMSHRVKNLFAIADSIVRLSAKSSTSVTEMEQILGGRFHALASAHSLVRRNFSPTGTRATITDLSALLKTLLQPHEIVGNSAGSRFEMQGPHAALGEHALNGIALMFHELGTNAAKYGALKIESGTVEIRWTVDAQNLTFYWIEHGGPQIAKEPETIGFGSKLMRDTITRQFHGQLENHWERDGLRATIRLPLDGLAN